MKIIITILLLSMCFNLAHAQKLNIVSSIRPLHSLVESLIQNSGQNSLLLIAGDSSPHHLQLKPSQIQSMLNADLIVYIDPKFETFINKVLSLNTKAKKIAFAKVPAINLLKSRSEAHNHPAAHPDAHSHAQPAEHPDAPLSAPHSHSAPHSSAEQAAKRLSLSPSLTPDLHLWLDINNVMVFSKYLASQLINLDQQNSEIYKTNLRATLNRLERVKADLALQLSAYQTSAFIVYHDAFQYFEKSFGLNSLAAINAHPEQALSLKNITKITKIIKQNKNICVFSEPQFQNKISNVVGNSQVKLGSLDPLGSQIAAGKDLYFLLMRELANSFIDCLSDN